MGQIQSSQVPVMQPPSQIPIYTDRHSSFLDDRSSGDEVGEAEMFLGSGSDFWIMLFVAGR